MPDPRGSRHRAEEASVAVAPSPPPFRPLAASFASFACRSADLRGRRRPASVFVRGRPIGRPVPGRARV